MTKIKEVLRLKFECGLSHRNIASCLKIGCATVSEIISRFNQSQIAWPLPDSCSDTELTNALYHPKGTKRHYSIDSLITVTSLKQVMTVIDLKSQRRN